MSFFIFFSDTSKFDKRLIFGSVFIISCLLPMPMLIPSVFIVEYSKEMGINPQSVSLVSLKKMMAIFRVGHWFYISVLTILPSIILPVFGILLYRQIKATQVFLQDNVVANETLKGAKVRAKIIVGISAVCVTSLLIYSLKLVSTALKIRDFFC